MSHLLQSNLSKSSEVANQYIKPSTYPQHRQISSTIFLCVNNTTSDDSNREIIDISDDDDEEKKNDENTCKNGTSIDDSSDEEEIEVIQLSDDDDEVNDESSGEMMETKVNKEGDNTGKSVFRGYILKTLGLTCSECSVLIETRAKLELHLLELHWKCPFKCMIRGCNEKFVKKSQLRNHYTDHSMRNVNTKWICSAENCRFETSFRNSFMVHVHKYHEKGLFQCSHCSLTYSYRSLLYNHIKTKHEYPESKCQIDSRFRCTFNDCSFVTARKYHLMRHQMNHTKLRPYRCDWPYCDYVSNYRGNVVQHVQARHVSVEKSVHWDPHLFVTHIPYQKLYSDKGC